ncbi:uncharacterized protein [Engystomops pustulosus]|uniref:uncharacterized protein n=1 Tax=Engystomops pustulosus TaxID=76066 RepID=UPI003AFB4CF8
MCRARATGTSETSQEHQRHHRSIRDITGTSETSQGHQRHHRSIRDITGASETSAHPQVKMGHMTLTLLCLAAYILVVTPLVPDAVFNATSYIEKNIFRGSLGQYAYFVKFTPDECNIGLHETTLQTALGGISGADVRTILGNTKPIYQGDRMVAAAPIDRTLPNRKKYKDHAEYRLLEPENNSAIRGLLNNNVQTGCVIFFSVLSPCVGKCTNPYSPYSIITRLGNVNLPNIHNARAFAFRIPYKTERSHPTEEQIWNSWANMNNVMPLYRCRNQRCTNCFDNNGRRVAACYT